MTTQDDRDLSASGHAPRPFEPGVFDDALDAHPPYQRYEGPVTAEAIAAARKKAAELGLLAPAAPRRSPAPRTSTTPPLAVARRRAK